ncbi:MAG: 2-C-methyl-D-erythritol 4-phosphate cytidylyltransferase [Roseburia sp.]
MNKFVAIVLSAGKGSRMNSQVHKQYMMLAGKPVIYYALQAFSDSAVDEIVLVVGAGEQEFCRKEIVEKYHFTKVTHIVEGGKERYHSVYEGLKACPDADYVLIHDGARPFLSQELIASAMEDVKKCGANIAAVPVKDTIKQVDESGVVIDTPRRDQMWSVQTPQSFSRELIMSSYECMLQKENTAITDDAMVVEQYGGCSVHVIFGDYCNIKITTPEDLLVAEAFVKRMHL